MSWQPVTGESANPFTIVREDGQYTASRGEHVFSDGGEVTLPAPEEDSLIVITSLNGNPVDIVGTVDGAENPTHALDQQKPVYLMSDGETWFHASKRDVLRIIGMIHIETQVADNDETIDFTEVFTESHDRYMVYIEDARAETASQAHTVRLSSDGGQTWDSGSSDYARCGFAVDDSGSTFAVGDSSIDKMRWTGIHPGNIAEDYEGAWTQIYISNPTDESRATTIRHSAASRRDERSSPFGVEMHGGIRLEQSSIDSIQILSEGGNFISGIFSVYGVDS